MGRLTSTINHSLFSHIKSLENMISSNNKKLGSVMAKVNNTSGNQKNNGENKKNKFELILDFVKATIWPIILLLFVVLFFHQISSMMEILPEKLKTSSKLSVANVFSVEINDAALAKGNPELAEIIKNLSKPAIETFLKLGKRRFGIINRDVINNIYRLPSNINYYVELEDKNLIKTSEKIIDIESLYYSLNLNSEIVYKENYFSDSYSYRFDKTTPYAAVEFYFKGDKIKDSTVIKRLNNCIVQLTDNGEKVYDIMVGSISDLINDATPVNQDTSKTK